MVPAPWYCDSYLAANHCSHQEVYQAMESPTTVRVEDRRRHDFFIIDNQIMDRYLTRIGPLGLVVYCQLSRMADRDGRSWPSQTSLAERLGVSRSSIVRAVSVLQESGLIRVEYRAGSGSGRRPSVYSLNEVPKRQCVTSDTLGQSVTSDTSKVAPVTLSPRRHLISEQDPEEQDPDSGGAKPKNGGRGTRLPSDWNPDQKLIDYAAARGFDATDLVGLVEDFCDYWWAIPGERGRKVDWAATFRRSVRMAQEKRDAKQNYRRSPEQSAVPKLANGKVDFQALKRMRLAQKEAELAS